MAGRRADETTRPPQRAGVRWQRKRRRCVARAPEPTPRPSRERPWTAGESEPVLLELPVERAEADAEDARRLLLVVGDRAESRLDGRAFDLLHRHSDRQVQLWRSRRLLLAD